VPLDYLVEEFEKIVAFKGRRCIEAHIDTVGDPITYPRIVELVSSLSQINGVETVSMQTHVVSNTKTDLLVAPVWIPGINDMQIPKIIRLTINIGRIKLLFPLGIQKYEIHKHGRKVKGIKPASWRKFYDQLNIWEREFKVRLVLSPKDFGIHKRVMLPISYKKFETVKVETVGSGWLKREKLAVTNKRDRSITLINAEEIPIGARLKARIVANKHNILIAEPI
jgi:uncharacterized Fe-S cluster-containing radical SAM superfamily enzyme